MIWGPHLLSLVAIWRKQDTETRAISFLPAISFFNGQHMLQLPHLPARPLFCMRATVAAFETRCVLTICSCSCGRDLGGGRHGNSQICILNKCCDLYSCGQTGRVAHTLVLPRNRGETERRGERENKRLHLPRLCIEDTQVEC